MSRAVLIVDDERNVLQSLKRLLHADGYELHFAESGPAALEILARTEIAVVLCDQRMPDMNGAQVLAEAYCLQPDAVRITLTGHTDVLTAQASINEGHVSQFLFKPWNDDHIRSVVRQSVESYRLVQENRRLESLAHRQQEELQDWNRRLENLVHEQTEGLRARNEDLQRLHGRLDQSLRDTVKLVAGMLEVHSPNLGIHCKRVAELARQLALLAGLDGEPLRDVEFAAHLHDIGKLSKLVAESSLPGRAGRIAKAPRGPMHMAAGYALLSQVSGFEAVAQAVRHLHERFDGNGLPDGLKRDEIPLASRIVAVANAYNTAVFSAANPTHVSHQAGCNVLQQGKGTRFDPQLVDLLLRYFLEAGSTAYDESEVEVSAKKTRPGMVVSRPIYNLAGTLVLKEGTRLTPDLIESIDRLGDFDPRLRSIFVRCRSQVDDGSIDPSADASTEPSDPQHAEGDADAHNTGSRSDADPRTGLAQTGRCRILVVDDSVFLCNALKRELHPDGIEVVPTQSGWTALDLIEQTHFDAVIVDLKMPAMPGEELVARLEQRAPKIPCIVLTSNATKERVVALAQKPNVVAILVKPWEHNRLVGAITAAIAKS